MKISLDHSSICTNKSVIVAGVTASGKTHLIDRLKGCVHRSKKIKGPLLVQREEVEAKNECPPESLIHWPIAEKDEALGNTSFDNAGVVILLEKNWEDYCYNVNSRNHPKQYSRVGLSAIHGQWVDFFRERNLPIISIGDNDIGISHLIDEIALKLKYKVL